MRSEKGVKKLNKALRVLDILVALGLFVFAFFAVTTGVAKTIEVQALVGLLIYSGVRLAKR